MIGVFLLIILILGINIFKQILLDNNIKVEVTTLTKESIVESVIVAGKLKFTSQEIIYFEENKETVGEDFINEGDTIKKGTKIFQYENKQLLQEKQQIELELQTISLQLDHIKKRHRNIDKQLKKDKNNEILQDEYDQIKLEEQMTTIEYERSLIQKNMINE